MSEHLRDRLRASAIATAAIAAAGITLFALIEVSARYPLPILIGARRGPLFAALTLFVALATAAVASEPSSRHPSLTMPRTERYWVLAWWIGAFTALASLSFAAWKGWGVVALFAALIALVKVLQAWSFIKQDRSVRVWYPFAAILGLFLCMVGIGQFLARPNLPPPIQAAMAAYQGARAADAPASRPAPDVSLAGLTLRASGDVDLGGLPATLFSYDDREGSRVDVYEADIGFPAPQGSVGVDDPPGWLSESYRLSLRTGPKGSNFLVVSWSTDVVNRIANALAAQLSP
jgi:hypothetical protein